MPSGRRGSRTGAATPDPPDLPATVPLDHATAELVRDLDVRAGWLLLLDGVPSSYVDLDDPTHLEFEYVGWIADILDLLAPERAPLDTVHVGGGAGTLARYIAATRPRSRQVVLEYDAKLVDLARTRLGLRSGPRLRVRAVDGRAGVAGLPAASYDVVVRDAFAGPDVPAHLATLEWVTGVRRVLREGGTYVVNVADRAPLTLARAEAATLLAQFRHVLLVAEPSTLRGRRYGNLVLAGSPRPLPVEDVARRVARGAAPARVLDTRAVRGLAGDARPRRDGERWMPGGLGKAPRSGERVGDLGRRVGRGDVQTLLDPGEHQDEEEKHERSGGEQHDKFGAQRHGPSCPSEMGAGPE